MKRNQAEGLPITRATAGLMALAALLAGCSEVLRMLGGTS